MTTAMFLPDLQIPYEDRRFVDKLVRVAERLQPDIIISIGDLMDFPEVSRWTKGLAGEYADTLQQSIDRGREVLGLFREACPTADIRWKEGNHDERIRDFVNRYAPPLRNLRSTSLEGLFELDLLGVDAERNPFRPLPGLVVMHGHEEAYSTVPGKWGLEQVKKQAASVVYGHTHQPILVTHTVGVGRNAKVRFAMNVGHGCDPKHMHYAKSGYFNWCRAFGVIRSDGNHMYPELILSLDGTFRFDGTTY